MVTAAAADDFNVRLGALWWRIITLGQALHMPGGATPLFTYTSGNYGSNWTAFLPQMVETIMCEEDAVSSSPWAVENLADFGHYLSTLMLPPWVDELADDLSVYLRDDVLEQSDTGSVTDPLPSPFAYLGAAATLCIIVESRESSTPPVMVHRNALNTLNAMYPYVARRANPESCLRREELPIPKPFQEAFNDWAEHKLNFTHRTSI